VRVPVQEQEWDQDWALVLALVSMHLLVSAPAFVALGVRVSMVAVERMSMEEQVDMVKGASTVMRMSTAEGAHMAMQMSMAEGVLTGTQMPMAKQMLMLGQMLTPEQVQEPVLTSTKGMPTPSRKQRPAAFKASKAVLFRTTEAMDRTQSKSRTDWRLDVALLKTMSVALSGR
jgi:hypothetical protein